MFGRALSIRGRRDTEGIKNSSKITPTLLRTRGYVRTYKHKFRPAEQRIEREGDEGPATFVVRNIEKEYNKA